ncbi:MAG TPA: alpha-L-rhamnosidase C-terminal domain-containing protein [Opitutaceae bacterium]
MAGIELDPEVPGFKRLVLKPHVADGLDFARATYRTMHGEIESHWQREASRFTWTVCIPANTSARVFIPCDPGADVKTDGLQALDHDGPYAICEAPAGRYRFESKFTST